MQLNGKALGVPMRIRDITIPDIRAGKNWRLIPEDDRWFDLPMEEWGPIEETTNFVWADLIVYSGLSVRHDGSVTAHVCIKEVGSREYGGDYCEYVGGRWRQAGLTPDPTAQVVAGYFANPLQMDRSFEAPDKDYRAYHRDGFNAHVAKLRADAQQAVAALVGSASKKNRE